MKQKTDEYLDLNAQNSVSNWMERKCSLKFIFCFFLSVVAISACDNKQAEKESRVDQLPYYQEASFTPHWLSKDDEVLKQFHQIPAFELINQNGDTVNESTFQDKIYVADFFFTTCPGICSRMTANLFKVQETFANSDDVLLMSHSVTPEKDSVANLKQYAEHYKVISGKWHLVTGPRDLIYKLGRQAYFVEEDLGIQKTDEEFLHTENFVLIDKNRHIRGIYNGLNNTSVEQLISDIKLLQLES